MLLLPLIAAPLLGRSISITIFANATICQSKIIDANLVVKRAALR
jgi:hypothetical protein